MIRILCIAASLSASNADLVINIVGDGLHKQFNFAVSLLDLPLDQGDAKCLGRVALELGNSFYVDPHELRNIENVEFANSNDAAWLHTHSGHVDIEKGEFSYADVISNSTSLMTPIVAFTAFFVDGWFNVSFPLHIRYATAINHDVGDSVHSVRCVGVFIYASCRGMQAGGLRAFAARRVSGLPPRPQAPPSVAAVASYAPDHPTYSRSYNDILYPLVILPNPYPDGFLVPGRAPDLSPRVDAALTYQEYYHLLGPIPPQATNKRLVKAAGGNRRTMVVLSQCTIVPTTTQKLRESADSTSIGVVLFTVVIVMAAALVG